MSALRLVNIDFRYRFLHSRGNLLFFLIPRVLGIPAVWFSMIDLTLLHTRSESTWSKERKTSISLFLQVFLKMTRLNGSQLGTILNEHVLGSSTLFPHLMAIFVLLVFSFLFFCSFRCSRISFFIISCSSVLISRLSERSKQQEICDSFGTSQDRWCH